MDSLTGSSILLCDFISNKNKKTPKSTFTTVPGTNWDLGLNWANENNVLYCEVSAFSLWEHKIQNLTVLNVLQ